MLGTIRINTVTGSTKKLYRESYPDITISYVHINSTVYFWNYDGSSLLRTATATDGGSVTYSGSAPTKPASASEVYTFSGWSFEIGGERDTRALLQVNEDRDLYPAFTASVRTFTVRFYVGSSCIQTKSNVPYGTATAFTGDTPTNTAESDPSDYEFTGWDKETTSVKADMNVYAQFRYIGLTYKHLLDGNKLGDIQLDNLKTVGAYEFYAVGSLTGVDFPEVESVGDYAFYTCTKLVNVNLPKVKTVGGTAFDNCRAIKRLSLPALVTAGKNAFHSCSGVEELRLDNMEVVAESAFTFLSSMKTLYIPKVKTINKNGFYCPSALEELNLPNTLETIGVSAFYCATTLKKLVIPASVKNIGDNAFQSCTGLKKVVFLGTPTSLSSKSFISCTGVTDVYVPWNYLDKSGDPWGCTNAVIHYGDESWIDNLDQILADEP